MPKRTTIFALLLLTLGALAVHGYHPYAEDAEIYLPGVEKILHPGLFPVGAEFFEFHANATFFPNLIASSIRISHLPFDYALFAWQFLSIFLFLLACWQLSEICFGATIARWGSVALVASLLTMPVAGTSLYIIDQYLNPRNLAAFAGVFAICAVIEKRYIRAVLWLAFAAAVHPLMSAFAVSLCILLVFLEKRQNILPFNRAAEAGPVLALLLPFGKVFVPPTPAYREALRYHSLHLIANWQWYELLGAIAPILIFICFGRIARARRMPTLQRLCSALVVYNVAFFAAGLVISIPKRFEALSRLQPLRSLHLLYIIMLVVTGGFAAEYFLKTKIWRWLLLFLPLCAGMFLAQRQLFPANQQVEWPWSAPKNPWEQAFLWIRQNTPTNAVFAISPFYMGIPGEGYTGFRALAERSRLPDAYKDSGAVSMFPPLAEEWWQQFQAQKDWKQFGLTDWERLRKDYGVSWLVLQSPNVPSLICPYRNSVVSICRIGS